jgi:vesicle coat complex subunit
VRALAIRTMSCLRAEKIIDYLSDPLSKALRDDNPYVRKTAAICVAKLYEMKPEMALEGGFVGTLRDMVGDANPMVSLRAGGRQTLETCCMKRGVEAGHSGRAA